MSAEPGRSDPFTAEGVAWSAVSPRLAAARRVTAALPDVVLAVLAAVAALLLPDEISGARPWLLLAAGLLVLAGIWVFWLAGRQCRAWGYAERDDDLLIRHGIMFRSLVVVPYGRMQFVDVHAGPVDRMFGIARVQLHTASAATDAYIPGLPPAEAARLRERLASRGEARLAGL